MTRRRFYAPTDAFAPDTSRVTLAPAEARHLRDVLRLQAGDEAFVFDGEGREFRCEVEGSGRESNATATLFVRESVAPQRPESPLALTLAPALLKGEKFDLVVQKATELGVARIVPAITKRADARRREAKSEASRIERWQRIALAAAKQSGRARVPNVSSPMPLATLLAQPKDQGEDKEARLIFTERMGRGFVETFNARHTRPTKATALIGAEGGWEIEEIEQATAQGWIAITLGGRTLRAETAAIVVVTLLQHAWGDLS